MTWSGPRRCLYVLLGLETWDLVRVELNNDVDGYRTWLLTTLQRTFTSEAFTSGAPEGLTRGRS